MQGAGKQKKRKHPVHEDLGKVDLTEAVGKLFENLNGGNGRIQPDEKERRQGRFTKRARFGNAICRCPPRDETAGQAIA